MIRQPTQAERDAERLKCATHMIAVLQKRIDANMDLARRTPSMTGYYVKVARLQNRWLRDEMGIARELLGGTYVRKPRKRRVQPAPDERKAATPTPHTLTPLAVALAPQDGDTLVIGNPATLTDYWTPKPLEDIDAAAAEQPSLFEPA